MRSLQAPRIGVAYGIWERLTRLRDLWPVSPVLFRRLALLTAFLMGAIIVSGGAVRLTGSGLGCPDWPNCFKHEYVAPLAFHPLVEFANRVFTVALSVSVGVTTLAALLRRPWRRDLALLSGGLLLGIIGQIILGGLVVIFKLYPPLVMIHFVFSIAIVVDAVVLHHRAGHGMASGRAMVGRELVWLSRLLFVTLAVVIAVGTAVTGAGPHAGDQNAVRLPVAFRDVAELHAVIVMFLIGMTLATLFALHVAGAPDVSQHRGRVLLTLMCLQGVIGYSQYFLHDNSLLVGLHLTGAAAVIAAATRFHLGLFHHPPERAPASEVAQEVLAATAV